MSPATIVPVILAGGQGTRFWPVSRSERPKQFLSISPTGESLIQATIKRLELINSRSSMLVVTNERHKKLILEHIPGVNVIAEPVARNTAASIGLGAIWLKKFAPQSIMAVFPADHHIVQGDLFAEKIKTAAEIARTKDSLVTLGITPNSPNTGYGYIRRGDRIAQDIFEVTRFFEKPSLERARHYVEQGEYYWNSGIFLWRPDVILAGIKQHMPELWSGLLKIEAVLGTPKEVETIKEVFEKIDPVSIDFGLLEHAKNCVVVEAGQIGWNDVGSWDAWAEHFKTDIKNNLLSGEAVALDSKNCVVYSNDRLIAVLGCSDLVVIDSKDALLVCPRSRVQDVKEIVSYLISTGRAHLV